MASDSEPRKFFTEAPSRPLGSHISVSKPCKATNDIMTLSQLELKLANSNSDSCRTTYTCTRGAHKLTVFSDGTCRKVFFRSVLMTKPRRACTHDSLLSAIVYLS